MPKSKTNTKSNLVKKPSFFSRCLTKKPLEQKNILTLALVVLVVVAFLLLKNIFVGGNLVTLKTKTIPDAVKKILGDTNTGVTIANLKSVSGVYEFELTLGKGETARKYNSYITKDGKIIFTSGIKLSELKVQSATTATQKKLTCKDLNKTDSSKLTAFVVSQCPFGLQMQRVFKKVLAEQPNLASVLDVKYLGSVEGDKITSMHGDNEAQENLKQICMREEQKNFYWPYLSCYMQEGKTDECLANVGVDTTSLQACVTDKTRGLTYAKKDFDLANKYQISSSPTLLLNDKQTVSEFDFGGRVPDAIREISCCGSKNQADYCSTPLSKDESASSFSVTDAPQQGNTGNAANCATQ